MDELPLGLIEPVTIHVKTLNGALFQLDVYPFTATRVVAHQLAQFFPDSFPCPTCIRLPTKTMWEEGDVLSVMIESCDPFETQLHEWKQNDQPGAEFMEEYNGVVYLFTSHDDSFYRESCAYSGSYTRDDLHHITESEWATLYDKVNQKLAQPCPIGHYVNVVQALVSPYGRYVDDVCFYDIILRSIGPYQWAPYVFNPEGIDKWVRMPQIAVQVDWL